MYIIWACFRNVLNPFKVIVFVINGGAAVILYQGSQDSHTKTCPCNIKGFFSAVKNENFSRNF